MKMEIQHTKISGIHWRSSKREAHSDTALPQDTRKISNNLTLHLKELEQTKPKVSRRKEIIKIKVEINEIETKTDIEKNQWN